MTPYNPHRLIGTRVELAAYLDHWMRGDRYGEIVACQRDNTHFRVKLDNSGKTVRIHGDSLNPI